MFASSGTAAPERTRRRCAGARPGGVGVPTSQLAAAAATSSAGTARTTQFYHGIAPRTAGDDAVRKFGRPGPTVTLPPAKRPHGLTVDWEPGIGDPSFMGWLTVAAYLARRCSARSRRGRSAGTFRCGARAQVAVWRADGGAVRRARVNKQLDLQSWFTAFGRAVLAREGWMEHRRRSSRVHRGVARAAVVWWPSRCGRRKRKRREYGLLVVGVCSR